MKLEGKLIVRMAAILVVLPILYVACGNAVMIFPR